MHFAENLSLSVGNPHFCPPYVESIHHKCLGDWLSLGRRVALYLNYLECRVGVLTSHAVPSIVQLELGLNIKQATLSSTLAYAT